MRILVVEDEPTLQQQVRSHLEAQAYVVEATGDGKEALYFASEYPFDAAVVDLGLPGLSGLEVIRRLRAQGSSRAADRTASACPGTFTLRQIRLMTPSRSMRKVARSIPIYLRP